MTILNPVLNHEAIKPDFKGMVAFWGSGGSGSDDLKCPKSSCGSTNIKVTELLWGGRVAQCRDCNLTWTLGT